MTDAFGFTAEDTATTATVMQRPKLDNTLVDIWTAVLSNVDTFRDRKLNMREAALFLGKHPYLVADDLPAFRYRYYDLLGQARDLLAFEAQNADLEDVENDAELNRTVYLNVILGWSKILQELELSWDIKDEAPLASIAAHGEASSFLLSDNGLLGQLDSIGFQYSTEDADTLTAALAEGQEV